MENIGHTVKKTTDTLKIIVNSNQYYERNQQESTIGSNSNRVRDKTALYLRKGGRN